MLVVALTGGIGSGKSAVGARLAARGAHVVETDELARAALAPGGPGVEAVAQTWPQVVTAGVVDRAGLAAVVFADEAQRRRLEAIVHPIVRAGVLAELESHRGTDDVVVLDVPLFVETGGRARYPVTGVLVVDAPAEVCIERLVATRAMTAEQASARIAAQADRLERIAVADFVIYNVGTLAELDEMVAGAWAWIEGLGEDDRARTP